MLGKRRWCPSTGEQTCCHHLCSARQLRLLLPAHCTAHYTGWSVLGADAYFACSMLLPGFLFQCSLVGKSGRAAAEASEVVTYSRFSVLCSIPISLIFWLLSEVARQKEEAAVMLTFPLPCKKIVRAWPLTNLHLFRLQTHFNHLRAQSPNCRVSPCVLLGSHLICAQEYFCQWKQLLYNY